MELNLDEIIREWSFRVANGMPDPTDSAHLLILRDVLNDHFIPTDVAEILIAINNEG